MIYLSAHPDELYFIWQTVTQLENFKSVGIDLQDVYILVGVKKENEVSSDWDNIREKYKCNVISFIDTRKSTSYIPSLRPHLISKLLTLYPHLGEDYIFYHDNDIIFRERPPFEGMMDGRWHVSKADYISYDYIEEKKSYTLLKHMLDSVEGVDENLIKSIGKECGGAQYFINNTDAAFWKEIENNCEKMFSTHISNLSIYKYEHFSNFIQPIAKQRGEEITFEDWNSGKLKDTYSNWDFQIWCTDMWCIFWTALKYNKQVVVDPILDFCWPKDSLERWEETYIYHNSGIQASENNEWLHKQSYKTITPFYDSSLDSKGFNKDENGTKIPAAQRKYIEVIRSIGIGKNVETVRIDKPLVSCIMTTYGRFNCVERSIGFWLDQSYTNKELVIYNTADVPLELSTEYLNKGIRVINNHYDLLESKPYDNVGAVRRDASTFAFGQFYICWDDDDMYLPWHIEQGIDYIIKNKKEAYMPSQSFWTPNGGMKIEFARNAMEASCIIATRYIRELGFDNSNGGEHLSWRRKLAEDGILDENYDVTPFESYMYIWGEPIAPHKQSGTINHPNNFEMHKAMSTDFGKRPLQPVSREALSIWYERLIKFVNNKDFTERLTPYLHDSM